MKKRFFAFFAALGAFMLSGGMTCFADAIAPSPIEEITYNPLPYIIGAVVAVIVISFIVLAVVNKRRNKK